MKTLKFTDELTKMILRGEKTTTFRIFDEKDLSKGDVIALVQKSTGTSFAKAELIKVYEKPLKDLSEEDYAGHEKFESAEEALATYNKYYNNSVTPNTSVKVVRFKLLG